MLKNIAMAGTIMNIKLINFFSKNNKMNALKKRLLLDVK